MALSISTQERASATTLALLSRCRTSVVNSDIAARGWACMADYVSADFDIMVTNGLWSVDRVNLRPLRR